MNNPQPETQSVSVEEWEKEFRRDFGSLLDKPICCPMKNNECGCDGRTYTDDVTAIIHDLLHTHSLATEEKNERLLLCLEDREKTIREQTQYIEAIRGAAGMGFNEFHEAIATKRGITLSDSK